MFPGAAHLASELNEQLRIAHRGQKAEALHNLAEQVRFRYGIVPPEGAEAHALLRSVRTIWDDRDLLFDRKSSPAGTVAALDDQFRGDLLELIATWAELRTRLAGPAGARAARDEALRILEEARSDYGPSFTIDRLRRSLAADLGRVESLPHVEAVPHPPTITTTWADPCSARSSSRQPPSSSSGAWNAARKTSGPTSTWACANTGLNITRKR